MVFLDFFEAFDRVDRKALFETLLRFKVPEQLVQAISKLHSGITVKFCIGTSGTKALPYSSWRYTCDSLSALLYIVFCNI